MSNQVVLIFFKPQRSPDRRAEGMPKAAVPAASCWYACPC